MELLTNYLDNAKAVTGSDRQTAIKLGCTPQYISQARSGEPFSDKFCFELAKLIGVDERLVIAAANYEAKKGKDKSYWRENWERVAGRMAGFLLIVALLPVHEVFNHIYYVK